MRLKRLLGSILAIALLLSTMNFGVFATSNSEYSGVMVGSIKLSTSKTLDTSDSGSGITEGSIIYDSVTGTLTLNNVKATAPEGYAAIHISPGTELTIVLVGDNTLTGATGCAGVWVEAGWDGEGNFSKTESARLTITGDGSLNATGGNALHGVIAGGAGIGGNGFGDPACTLGGDFGVIIIENGNITANGGTDDDETKTESGSDYGAGAGIGGGGILGNNYNFYWTYSGVININGGTVTANGGCGYTGASGIGAGSAGSSDGALSDISITITDGYVTANGGTDAAGIGSGSNGASGPITITGGTVIANGGDENDGSSYGGAGIGGGDNGESGVIIIKGDAVVTATAGGTSAGIGGGNGGYVTQIIIDDEATVTAYGGSHGTKERGGAGIGSGYQGDFGVNEKTGNIYINTTGKVIAYSGKCAMAIGIGSHSLSNYYFEVGRNAAEIWMFNQDTVQKPFIDDPAYITGFEHTLTAFYKLPEGETYPVEDELSDVYTVPGGVKLNWKHVGNTISLIRDGSVIKTGEFDSGLTIGNWAVVIPQVDFSVKYEWNGDVPSGDFEQSLPAGDDNALYGSSHVVDTTFTSDTVVENVIDGTVVGKWTFSGWDKSGTITIEDSVVIKGTWSYEGYLAVDFEKTVDENGDLVEARDEKIYDINLVAYNGKDINRLNSVDLTFILNNTFGNNAYEIIDIEDDNIAVNHVEGDRYEFHFSTKTNVTNDTAATITLARVKFIGYGKFTFGVDASTNTNAAHATKLADNIVDTYVPGGVAIDGKKVGTLIIDNEIEDEIFTPTQKLTVELSFPNYILNNVSDYQDMNVTLSGTGIADISVDLGSDNVGERLAIDHKPDAEYVLSFDEETKKYTLEFFGALTVNNAYTVTVSGSGYRTARYTVTMTEDKVLKFWNNVMDEKQFVEIGKESSKVNVTFLAGDIVKDNNINIYDLSAVVSYFGTQTVDEGVILNAEYAKYDLNRDGVIDSKDVAYVLVSWDN